MEAILEIEVRREHCEAVEGILGFNPETDQEPSSFTWMDGSVTFTFYPYGELLELARKVQEVNALGEDALIKFSIENV